MFGAVGDAAWAQVKCVATDGGSSFPWLLQNMLPGIPHLLCLYHIHANLKKQLGGMQTAAREMFKAQFARCAYTAATAAVFDKEWDTLLDLVSGRAKLVDYLNTELHKRRTQWARAWTAQYCTFGARSTQRVESINRMVKHFMPGNASLKQLYIELDKIFNKQLKRREQRLLHDQVIKHKYDGAIYQEAVRHITKQAAELVHQQESRCNQYVVAYHATPPLHSRDVSLTSFAHTAMDPGTSVVRISDDLVDSPVIRTSHDVITCTAHTSDACVVTRTRTSTVQDAGSASGYSVRLRGKEDSTWHWVCVDDNQATCSDCDFAQNYLLPCRHILAVNLVHWPEGSGYRVEQCHLRWRLADMSTTRSSLPFVSTACYTEPEVKSEDTAWSLTSTSEPSQDVLYNRFMAKASRLAEFLKPHGEAQFKQAEVWMDGLIRDIAAVDAGNTVTNHLIHAPSPHVPHMRGERDDIASDTYS